VAVLPAARAQIVSTNRMTSMNMKFKLTLAMQQVASFRTILVVAAFLTSVSAGRAQVIEQHYTAWGHIVALETGWFNDTMSITLDPSVPFVNGTEPGFRPGEHFCTVKTAGYALDPADAGVKVHQAALLSGYIAGKHVRLLVSGCVFSKPRVIAVGLMD
jgi:hypothetical protein